MLNSKKQMLKWQCLHQGWTHFVFHTRTCSMCSSRIRAHRPKNFPVGIMVCRTHDDACTIVLCYQIFFQQSAQIDAPCRMLVDIGAILIKSFVSFSQDFAGSLWNSQRLWSRLACLGFRWRRFRRRLGFCLRHYPQQWLATAQKMISNSGAQNLQAKLLRVFDG